MRVVMHSLAPFELSRCRYFAAGYPDWNPALKEHTMKTSILALTASLFGLAAMAFAQDQKAPAPGHHAAPAIDAGVPVERIGAVEEFTFTHDYGPYPHQLLER